MSHLHKERETDLEKAHTNDQGSQEQSAEEKMGGLAIVKKAVESQRGGVSLSSAPGQGSTFCFTWLVDTVLTQS